ncbi:MAG: HTH-type transcriptional repressor GlcR [Anaerolineales bacterium]|nr:HTH-type transcriptional repressor GlcR [Anaerolineales bacterium]
MVDSLNVKDLYPEERRRHILDRIRQNGRVSVSRLSQAFGVSEVTIRADLQALVDRNLVVRTHGGAILASHRLPELSLSFRQQQQILEKSRIGEAGAAMVSDGDAIFLDTSSTALALASHIKNRRELTIITNSLAVVQAMLDAPGVTVVMPGGTLRRETASLIGIDGLTMLQQFNVQKGFFGAHGISKPEGLTDVSVAEAEVKRMLVGMCRQVITVLDASKWGRVGLASFADLENVDYVITDDEAPAELVDQVRGIGIEVLLV